MIMTFQEISQLSNLGGVFIIAILLLRHQFNDMRHVQKTLDEIKELLERHLKV